MTEKNFILASGSVPRRQLLEQIGYTPKLVDPADIDETTGKYETPTAYVKRMAVEKASAVAAPPPPAEPPWEPAETAESSTAACALTRAVARIDSREAELIVSGLLLRVGKHIVSFVDLLEFSLCLGIIRIKVGVVFLCHLTVRLLDLSVGSALFQTQHLVIVFFIHK